MMANKLEYINTLINSCFLPETIHDLDDCPPFEFNEYNQKIQHQLSILYDCVQQNEYWIFNDSDTLEVRCNLLILLCEITGTTTVLNRDPQLVENANRLLRLHLEKTLYGQEKEFQLTLEYYQKRLKKESWKRNLGAVHGFLQFLKEFFDFEGNRDAPKMSSRFATFCLSIGLTFRDCHDPVYKEMSTIIFYTILKCSHRDAIVDMNIHSVIYDSVFKTRHMMETVSAVNAIWDVLRICLDYRTDIDSFSWNPADDMIETLLSNITLAPNANISICLLSHISKICYRFSSNRTEIEKNIDVFNNFDICRKLCTESSSHESYRWAKSILEMFIAESNKLTGSLDICYQLLQEMLKCYIVCILPIPVEILKFHLYSFFNKFCAILMEIIVTQRHDQSVIKIIHQFIETFQWQLKRPNITETQILLQFQKSFEKLLRSELFSAS